MQTDMTSRTDTFGHAPAPDADIGESAMRAEAGSASGSRDAGGGSRESGDRPSPSSGQPDREVRPPGLPDEDAVVNAIATVFDPEIPVNIYELGLIYAIDLHDDGRVEIEMTLTAPNCPSAQELPEQVRDAVAKVDGVTQARVEIVWDPPWDMSRMSDDARLALNMF